MQLDHRVEKAILDIASKIQCNIALLDEIGDVLASTDEKLFGVRDEFLDEVVFIGDIGHTATEKRTYIQVKSDNYRPLFVVIQGESDTIEKYCYLIAAVVQEILKTTLKKPGREEAFKRILLDQIDPLELQETIRDFKIDLFVPRCVILVQTFESDAVNVYNVLSQLFSKKAGDVIVNINRYAVALVKIIEDDNGMEEIVQLTQAIQETLENEIVIHMVIGVGNVKQDILGIHDSFKEAQEAINLGLVQQSECRIFMFQRLLLERFLQDIPREIRKRFYELAYDDTLRKLLSDEMMETVERFFSCNLNLSETARKLYIHRNTLIYRLDKIQKVTSLDLRNFEDATLLKIIIMLGKSLSANNRME